MTSIVFMQIFLHDRTSMEVKITNLLVKTKEEIEIQSVSVWFRNRSRKLIKVLYPRQKQQITQDTRRHQPPKPVPLLNTPLYLLFFLNQVMMFIKNPLIATEALHKGLQNKKKDV